MHSIFIFNIPLLLRNRSFMTGFCAKWWQSKYLRKTKPVIMTGLYTNSLLNCLRKLLILTLFFQNENYNCLKYLFLINRCGKPNKIICFILYPFNIYTVLYLKIIIVGVFLFKNVCKVFVIISLSLIGTDKQVLMTVYRGNST